MKYTNKLLYKEAQNNMEHKESNLELGAKNGSVVKGFVEDFSEFASQYFTIEALEDGTVGIVTMSHGTVITNEDYLTGFSYSLDDGATWTTNTSKTFQIPVTKGQKVLWQRNATWPVSAYSYPYDNDSTITSGGSITSGNWWWQTRCSFHCTCKYKVYGNITTVNTGTNFFGMFCEMPKSVNLTIDVNPTSVDIPGGDPLPITADADCADEYEMHKLVDAYGLYIDKGSANFSCMFANCQRLENAPFFSKHTCGWDKEVIAGTKGYYYSNKDERAFDSTFYNCYSLKKCRINMRDLTKSYQSMFRTFCNCLSMQYGPVRITGYEKDNLDNVTRPLYIYRRTNTLFNCQSLLSFYISGKFVQDNVNNYIELSLLDGSNSTGFVYNCKSLKWAKIYGYNNDGTDQNIKYKWQDWYKSNATVYTNLTRQF